MPLTLWTSFTECLYLTFTSCFIVVFTAFFYRSHNLTKQLPINITDHGRPPYSTSQRIIPWTTRPYPPPTLTLVQPSNRKSKSIPGGGGAIDSFKCPTQILEPDPHLVYTIQLAWPPCCTSQTAILISRSFICFPLLRCFYMALNVNPFRNRG